MRDGYWELFWQTGLPEVWLIWRAEKEPETLAAITNEEDGETLV